MRDVPRRSSVHVVGAVMVDVGDVLPIGLDGLKGTGAVFRHRLFDISGKNDWNERFAPIMGLIGRYDPNSRRA